jgi:hypothetical protein
MPKDRLSFDTLPDAITVAKRMIRNRKKQIED